MDRDESQSFKVVKKVVLLIFLVVPQNGITKSKTHNCKKLNPKTPKMYTQSKCAIQHYTCQ